MSGGISVEAYLALGSTLLILAAGFVAIRCTISSMQTKRFAIDDAFAIFGLLFTLATFIVQYKIAISFLDPTTSPIWAIKMGVIVVILILFALWTTKAPILFLYIKLFGVYRWLRWASYTTLLLSGLSFIGAMAITLAHCDLTDDLAQPSALGQCISASALGAIISGFFAVATDIVIFCLPIQAVVRMNISLSKKIGLAIVFGTGILGITSGIISLYYKFLSRQVNLPIRLRAATILLIHVECCVALFVGCVPMLKVFWCKHVAETAFAKAISTYTSSTLVASKRICTRLTKNTTSQVSTKYDTQGENGPYIEMD